MKDLLEALSVLVYVAIVAGLAFVFRGTPDLWDKWHAQAMGSLQNCVVEKEERPK